MLPRALRGCSRAADTTLQRDVQFFDDDSDRRADVADGDVGILHTKGQFDARRFDEVFGARSAVGRDGDGALTEIELAWMVNAERKTPE